MDKKLRILVVGASRVFSDTNFDGFVTRQRRLTHLLAERHDVGIIGLRTVVDKAEIIPDLKSYLLGDFPVPVDADSRQARVRAISSNLRGSAALVDWESPILAAATAFEPDVVLTFGPWLDVQYRCLRAAYPSIHMFEEDVWRMPDLAPQSLQGRTFRRAEALSRRRLAGQPTAVVVIADQEIPAARDRYAVRSIHVMPYTPPSDDWPAATELSVGHEILVLGVLVQERNSDGLLAVLQECDRRGISHLQFRLLSDAGLHEDLQPFLDRPWVRQAEAGEEVWRHYRDCRLSLVPATRATGIKTTVLQAWSQGTPVITFAGSASTLVPAQRDAMSIGDTAGDVVDRLLALWEDDQERTKLAARGLEIFASDFDEQKSLRTLEDLLGSIVLA